MAPVASARFHHQIDAPGALRIPPVRLVGDGLFLALFGVDRAVAFHLAPAAADAVRAAPFVGEGGDGYLPAVAGAGNLVFRRHAGIGEEHLVERRMAVHLLERAHVNAALVHVQDEVGKPLVLGRVPIRARQQQAVVRMVGAGGPHLLAVDDPLLAVELGTACRAGEVGTAARLAEELAPGVFAGKDAAQILGLLRVGAVFQQRCRRQQANARLGNAHRADARELFLHDGRQRLRQVAPEPVLRPRRHSPAGVGELAAPLGQARVRIPVRVQPSAGFCAHGLRLGAVRGRVLRGTWLGRRGGFLRHLPAQQAFPMLRGAAEEHLGTFGALVPKVRVVVPGEADAAVDLDAVLGRLHVGIRSRGLGKAGERRQAGVSFGSGIGRLVGGGFRQFHGEQQFRAAMLDGLERADRPPELHPRSGVVHGGFEQALRAAHHLVGQGHFAEAKRRRHCVAGPALGADQASGRVLETDLGELARRIKWNASGCRESPGASASTA